PLSKTGRIGADQPALISVDYNYALIVDFNTLNHHQQQAGIAGLRCSNVK
ncbi:MAG: hypothetical protein JWQ40_1967, partial [Segetibacter sp.]|nr:hypothetical protein [Segetibacter sp.]